MPVPDNNSVNIYDLPIRFYSLQSKDKALRHALELRIMYWTWSEADIGDPASVAVEWLAFTLSIQEVPGSNHSPENWYIVLFI